MGFQDELIEQTSDDLLMLILEIDKELKSQHLIVDNEDGSAYINIPCSGDDDYNDKLAQYEGFKSISTALLEQLRIRVQPYKDRCKNKYEVGLDDAQHKLYNSFVDDSGAQSRIDKLLGVRTNV